MNEQTTQQFIEDQKNVLIAIINEAKEHHHSIKDVASLTEAQRRLREMKLKEALKAQKALEKMEDGEYLYCSACEEDISVSRLTSSPTALLCIKCQKELETQQEKDERLSRKKTPFAIAV